MIQELSATLSEHVHLCASALCFHSMTLGSSNLEGVRSGLKVVTGDQLMGYTESTEFGYA
jgi:hypothetical protein